MKKQIAAIVSFFGLMPMIYGQSKAGPDPVFRLGATIAFGLSHIAANNVGIGGLVGAEKHISKYFAVEMEASYTYFTGDDNVYAEGNNKSYAIPLMAGIKYYPLSHLYASLRTGAVYFQLNNTSSTKVRPAIGIAAGMNLTQKVNRVNIQLGYNGFRHNEITRGYATLAASIIIN